MDGSHDLPDTWRSVGTTARTHHHLSASLRALSGPEEYRQVVAYHYGMARHHLFKAQTYRDHAKARYGVQLPLFDADGAERDGAMEAPCHD